MYRTILLARMLDQKIWGLNRMGKAPFVVSGQGHEGAQVGSAWALRAGHDIVLPYYRDTGVLLTLGMTAEEILLAVFARADDPNSGGRQMPNHWGCAGGNVITGSSPIATQLPHAAGLAYAAEAPRRGPAWRSATSARAPPRRATSTRRSTSPASTSSRWCSSARTTATPSRCR